MRYNIKRLLFICLMAVSLPVQVVLASEAGGWTVYPAHGNITWIEKTGNKVFVLDTYNLFMVDLSTGEVRTFDKTNGLSDSNISNIAWCNDAKRLVILYANYNIDLLDVDGNVLNVSDYYSKSTSLEKTVNGLNVNGKYAYLSTNFGVVQVDCAEGVIKNTYNLGFKVNWTHFDNENIFAESSSQGEYKGSWTANLLDKSQWVKIGDYTEETRILNQEVVEQIRPYIPNGPLSTYCGFTSMYNNNLLVIPGHKSSPPRNAYFEKFDGSSWTNINDDISYISTRRYRNLYFIAPFPGEEDHYYLGGETGLYEMQSGKITKEYWFGNSPLQCAASLGETHTNYSIVSSGVFDSNKNFWCLAGEAANPGIYKLDANANWTFFPHEEMRATETTAFHTPVSLFIDSRGLMWFVNNYYTVPALTRYDSSKDEMKSYTSFTNEDGTSVSVSYPTCCAEDKNGNIWFGSWAGVLYLAADDIYSDKPTFQQVKVPRNDGSNLADYLLANIHISCMAIDGGNRKWFGTETNGVYVISDDCMTEVHHFTAENSPLLSNGIEYISVDGTTGEVYISTNKGLCSYRAEATTPQEEMKSSNVYAYPNPVEPSFTGVITINGLTYNSSVKIVTSAGTAVCSGRSTGGSFQWNGCDNDGKKVASGVYTVLVVDQDGKQMAGCKVAVIR